MNVWLYLAAAVGIVVLLNVLLVVYFLVQNAWHERHSRAPDDS